MMKKNNPLQFMKGALLEYEESLRQTGRTTHDVEEARETGAVLICHNDSFARMISKKFGVKTVSLERYMSDEYHRGRRNPPKFIFEHFCKHVIIMQKLDEAQRIIG
jgi:hypothetical protein